MFFLTVGGASREASELHLNSVLYALGTTIKLSDALFYFTLKTVQEKDFFFFLVEAIVQ